MTGHGSYTPCSLHTDPTARCVALDNTFHQTIETELPSIITLVKGDPTRAQELAQFLFSAWDEMLNSFATLDEFEVLFEDDDERSGLDEDFE